MRKGKKREKVIHTHTELVTGKDKVFSLSNNQDPREVQKLVQLLKWTSVFYDSVGVSPSPP